MTTTTTLARIAHARGVFSQVCSDEAKRAERYPKPGLRAAALLLSADAESHAAALPLPLEDG